MNRAEASGTERDRAGAGEVSLRCFLRLLSPGPVWPRAGTSRSERKRLTRPEEAGEADGGSILGLCREEVRAHSTGFARGPRLEGGRKPQPFRRLSWILDPKDRENPRPGLALGGHEGEAKALKGRQRTSGSLFTPLQGWSFLNVRSQGKPWAKAPKPLRDALAAPARSRSVPLAPARLQALAPARSRRGSALLLVLFTILLLSSLIIATVQFVRHDIDEYAVLSRRFAARTLAQTGVAYALPTAVRNEDRPLLEQTLDTGKFNVVIASESARLNINFLLQNKRDYLLQSLFREWGLGSRVIDPAIAGLHRYTDKAQSGENLAGSDLATAAAATTPAATPTPTNVANAAAEGTNPNAQAPAAPLVHPFRAVEEMSLVPEFAAVMRQYPDWAQTFTVYGDGKIDVNTTDAEILRLVTGVSPAQADRFIRYRWGRDGKPFTSDDQIYRSLEDVRVNLGLSPQQFNAISDLLAVSSAVDRIESTGIVAGFTVRITALVNRNISPAQIISWQER